MVQLQPRDEYQGRPVTAPRAGKPGEYVRCDMFGRFLSFESHQSNGLGLWYQVNVAGRLVRSFF